MGRARKLKALRSEVERQTVGQPQVGYWKDSDGSVRLRLNTTRGLYRRAKRALSRA